MVGGHDREAEAHVRFSHLAHQQLFPLENNYCPFRLEDFSQIQADGLESKATET